MAPTSIDPVTAVTQPATPAEFATPPLRHPAEIAYIMKGFPRRSEPFISNEIFLLEQLGLTIRVFALKGMSEDRNYAPVDRIQATVTYVPEETSVEQRSFLVWLCTNLPGWARSHWGCFLRRPWAYITTALYTLFLSVRYAFRPNAKWPIPYPRRVFYKDFLRAGYIGLQVLQSPGLRHLHGHFCHGSTTITMMVAMLTGVPYSFTAHAKDIYLERLNPGNLLRRKIRGARFVATCTGANYQHLQAIDLRARHIHTIYHGLDTSLFVPPQGGRRARASPLILSVGRFVAKKGFPVLVEACRILRDRQIPFRCLIVGGADVDSPIVERHIREYELHDRVSMRPSLSQEGLRELYQQADIFALPCVIAEDGDRDGIPNVLAEAMAAELAVVSTDVSGIPEIVENRVNGVLVPQRNAEALADALAILIDDPQQRECLGRNARQTICEVFDSKRTTRALYRLFQESLNGLESGTRNRQMKEATWA